MSPIRVLPVPIQLLTKKEVARIKSRVRINRLPSKSHHGQTLWNACKSKVVEIPESTSSSWPSALLSMEEHQRLKKELTPRGKEYELVKLLTPILMELVRRLPLPKILVNSERFGWIRTETGVHRNFQKPDLFVCDQEAFVAHPAPKDTSFESKFLFGTCKWHLRDSVLCLIEVKRKISVHEAIGEIQPKAQNMLRGNTTMTSVKCCLFDTCSVYLLEFSSDSLISSQHFLLTAGGAYRLISDFILPSTSNEPECRQEQHQLRCRSCVMCIALGDWVTRLTLSSALKESCSITSLYVSFSSHRCQWLGWIGRCDLMFAGLVSA